MPVGQEALRMDGDLAIAALANQRFEAVRRLARQGATGGDDRDLHSPYHLAWRHAAQWGSFASLISKGVL